MVNPLINTDPSFRPDAPFRKYDKTDESVRKDGYESGLNWRETWDHLPGGPYVPRTDRYSRSDSHPDWVAYCELLAHHNRVWLEGWHEGFKEAARRRPAIKRLRSNLTLRRLMDDC